jgi:protein-disulfide isomerase
MPRLPLPLCAALLFSVACLPERGKVPDKPPVAAKPAARPAAAAAPKGPTAPPHGSGDGCAGAALTLAPGTVVARVDGADVRVEELGEELAAAEAQALREYCQGVTQAREAALDNYLQEKLLTAAAAAAGKDISAFVREKVEAEVPPPDEAAIAAFYEANKTDSAPPLELVRDQVIQAMNGEKSQAVLEKLLGDLQARAKVERMLPDVAPPPMDLTNPAHAPVLGAEDAVVQVVEFSDFECPYCSRAADTMRGLKEKYAGRKVQFVYRHFPLSFHPNARPAAEYAQCAHEQGKFWAMHDGIFAAQRELSTDKLKELASQAGVDASGLAGCLASGRAGLAIDEDMRKAREVGVQGTPSFYVNGQSFSGNPTVEGLSQAIDAQLAKLEG